jgi:hypothetical protein
VKTLKTSISYKTNNWASRLFTSQSHPKPLGLVCPCCSAGPFTKLASFAGHIERGECSTLHLGIIDKLQEQKLSFSKHLQQLTGAPLKNDFWSYVSQGRPFDVVGNPDTHQKHVSQQEEMEKSPWFTMEPEGGAYETGEPVKPPPGLADDADHPHHPAFQVDKYFSPVSEVYRCPKGCM